MEIEINIEDHASDMIKTLLGMIEGENRSAMNQIAGEAALIEIVRYHREFDEQGGWKKPGPTHGAGRDKTRFGENITRAWAMGEISADGVQIINSAQLLGFKIRGGTISAKSAKALTIPMVPEAHGKRVADYPGKLFSNKKETALMESDEDGNVRVVYLLRKSVTQEPTEGAMPDEDVYVPAFMKSITDQLTAALS